MRAKRWAKWCMLYMSHPPYQHIKQMHKQARQWQSIHLCLSCTLSQSKGRFSTAGCLGLWPLSNMNLSFFLPWRAVYTLTCHPFVIATRVRQDGEQLRNENMREIYKWNGVLGPVLSLPSSPIPVLLAPRAPADAYHSTSDASRIKTSPQFILPFITARKEALPPEFMVFIQMSANAGWIMAAHENIIYC